MATLKTCKNCKYFQNDIPFILNYGKCARIPHIVPESIDPISGKILLSNTEYSYASTERKNYGICKEEALLYEYEDNVYKRFVNQQYGIFAVILGVIITTWTYIIIAYIAYFSS